MVLALVIYIILDISSRVSCVGEVSSGEWVHHHVVPYTKNDFRFDNINDVTKHLYEEVQAKIKSSNRGFNNETIKSIKYSKRAKARYIEGVNLDSLRYEDFITMIRNNAIADNLMNIKTNQSLKYIRYLFDQCSLTPQAFLYRFPCIYYTFERASREIRIVREYILLVCGEDMSQLIYFNSHAYTYLHPADDKNMYRLIDMLEVLLRSQFYDTWIQQGKGE